MTGGVKPGELPITAAKRELLEETGYEVIESELVSLGCVYPSKQEDTGAYLFAVDVTGKVQYPIRADGSTKLGDCHFS